nr:N-6 DNA methylase [Candidatus Sigynarchaeota archaeon]
MLETLTKNVRDAIAILLEQKHARFLQQIEHWRAIERDLHGQDSELDLLSSQITFLIAVISVYARSISPFGTGGHLTQDAIADDLCEKLRHDDQKFIPYVEITSMVVEVISPGSGTMYSNTFKYIDGSEKIDSFDQTEPSGYIDLFSPVYQALFSSSNKHASGEHYTPAELCELMLGRSSVNTESTILDPTCGAGAFLVTAIHMMKSQGKGSMLRWLKRIHGEDLNPVAIIAARVNAWFQARDLGIGIEFFFETIKISDIFANRTDQYDIIIGNPPWVTLKEFSTNERKALALDLAKALNIAPDAHGVPQLELATIVFSKCIRDRLKIGGSIFFVMTSSFLDGKHCSKFRLFENQTGVEIWLFNGASVFPRNFACLFAWKENDVSSYFKNYPDIPVISWNVEKNESALVNRYSFSKLGEERYQPVNLVEVQSQAKRGGQVNVARLISTATAKELLPASSAGYYKALCYNGATIFPQSLLFVAVISEQHEHGEAVVTMIPAPGLKMKKPWNVAVYDRATVEKRYIFNLVKGSELYPFGMFAPWHVFLPIKIENGAFQFDTEHFSTSNEAPIHPTLATSHFKLINIAYQTNCKNLKRIPHLWARINFDNELTNNTMTKPFKVVIPDCGSSMAASLVDNKCIVEHALHFIGLDDEDEAYYLLGVLNSPILARDVLARKAERHIGQLALDYPIPRFDSTIKVHSAIARTAKDLERLVSKLVSGTFSNDANIKLSRKRIKKKMDADSTIKAKLSQLDALVLDLINGGDG